MILAIDVDYRDREAFAVGVEFNSWQDERPEHIFSSRLHDVEDYEPGKFYKRELPCILQLLREHSLTPAIILIDGFVFLDGDSKPGLGKHLYDALSGNSAVIGVAKQPYKGIADEYRVYRGKSTMPLYVTAAGISTETAKSHITAMHGQFRIPTQIKLADQMSRTWQDD